MSNTQTSFDDIAENYARIRENMAKAMAEAGRTDRVQLMAVTKTVSPDRINRAVTLGADLLGENRVQEFLEKRESYLPAPVHFIGSLQSNKVKYIIDKVTMIHSVDSLRLAREIDRRAAEHGIVMDILAEINIGGEETKGGISPTQARELCDELCGLENVRLRGLMTIPPPCCGEQCYADMQALFVRLGQTLPLRDRAAFDTLSMGMSGDYETAIKYGATIIRVGSGLFGYRKYL